MIETLVLGGALRVCEAFLSATPTLLCGFLTVAVFRVFLGPKGVQSLYNGSNGWGLIKSWGMGMLLPVCSLGTLPILRELRRSRVTTGSILAFALTEPLFNPLSLIYGLTLAEPWAVILFAAATFVVVTVIGFIWDWAFPLAPREIPDEPQAPAGGKRLTLTFVTALDQACDGRNWIWIGLGLSGSLFISSIFPHGSLQGEAMPDNPVAPARMAFLAFWVYSTPLAVMGQLASMLQHGNSIGAAFVLFVFGTGIQPGTIGWLMAEMGVRKTLLWAAMLISVTLGLAYAIDKPLTPRDVEPANHTHAFDGYSNPFPSGGPAIYGAFAGKLQDAWTPDVRVCFYLLAGLVVSGLIAHVTGLSPRLRSWALTPVARSRYDVSLPGWAVGLASVGGLVAFSVVGCYIYYPDQETKFAYMVRTKTEVIATARVGDWELAAKYIPILESDVRDLLIGAYLREFSLSDYRRMKARVLLHKLELLEHAVEDGHRDEVDAYAREVEMAYRRLRDAFPAATTAAP